MILYGDDSAAATMATGFTFNVSWDGGAAADGDTYVTFTENFSFESAPAGSVLYLTNAQSGLSSVPALISDFTGSDENPLSEGGNWANLNSSGNPLLRVSNATSASVAAASASYWTPANFGADLEAYATITTLSSGSVGIVTGSGRGRRSNMGRLSRSSEPRLCGRHLHSDKRCIHSSAGVRPNICNWRQDWDEAERQHHSVVAAEHREVLIESWADPHRHNLCLCRKDRSVCDSNGQSLGRFLRRHQLQPLHAEGVDITRGGCGVVSLDTDAGFLAPLYQADWYTPQLTAFTLTGMAVGNLRALESNASANATLRCEIARVESDGTSPTVWANWCMQPITTDNGELGLAEAARTVNVSGDDLAVSDGQRLRIRVYSDDMSSTAMGNAFRTQVLYNGTSAAASGDIVRDLRAISERVRGCKSRPTACTASAVPLAS